MNISLMGAIEHQPGDVIEVSPTRHLLCIAPYLARAGPESRRALV